MLKSELLAVAQEQRDTLSEDVLQGLQQANQQLVDNQVGAGAARVGDPFPQFSLPNAIGNAISSDDLLANGPLVVCFYRGGWCPYCNLELRAYQQLLPEIRKLGADFLAISPQLPDESLNTAAKASLTFEVLTDTGNSLATHLGLVFEVADDVADLYRGMGFDLERINGNTRWTLPVPATFVIGMDYRVALSFVDPDYTVRAEPESVLEALRSL